MVHGEVGAQYWRSIIEDYTASGINQELYCRERKVSKASLYSWSRRLGISLRRQGLRSQMPQINEDIPHANFVDREEAFSFIELEIPQQRLSTTTLVKLELSLPANRKVKIEAAVGWENITNLIKALLI